jgi:hypothetical protein
MKYQTHNQQQAQKIFAHSINQISVRKLMYICFTANDKKE